MPLPALRCRSELAIVKMVMASGLSLRGPKGAVAISQYTAESQAGFGENVTAFPRLPRRFAPRNDTSGECRSAPAPSCGLMILYKALTERPWQLQVLGYLRQTHTPCRGRRPRRPFGIAFEFAGVFLLSNRALRDCHGRRAPSQ